MSYDDIYRSWGRIEKAMREGNERDRENWRKIMERCEKTRKTQKDIIREICDKNRKDNEEKFKKLDDLNTPDLERDIILCEYFCIAVPLALTGHVYTLHKPSNRRKKK